MCVPCLSSKSVLAINFDLAESLDMAETQHPPVTAEALREKLGVSTGHASDLINRNVNPSLKLAVRIHRTLGVPVEFWIDNPVSRGEPAK
jgi:transcriptional regulator with XRE-family HTH domain